MSALQKWLGFSATLSEGVQHNGNSGPSLRGAKRQSNPGTVLVTEIATPRQVAPRNDTCYVIARSKIPR